MAGLETSPSVPLPCVDVAVYRVGEPTRVVRSNIELEDLQNQEAGAWCGIASALTIEHAAVRRGRKSNSGGGGGVPAAGAPALVLPRQDAFFQLIETFPPQFFCYWGRECGAYDTDDADALLALEGVRSYVKKMGVSRAVYRGAAPATQCAAAQEDSAPRLREIKLSLVPWCIRQGGIPIEVIAEVLKQRDFVSSVKLWSGGGDGTIAVRSGATAGDIIHTRIRGSGIPPSGRPAAGRPDGGMPALSSPLQSLDTFRSEILARLHRPNYYVIANYSREPVGQGRYGHIATVLGYDGGRDMVLMGETNQKKYPAHWAPAELIYRGIRTEAHARGGLWRGVLEVWTK